MGLMHSWVQLLIDDVTLAVKFGKPFAHGRTRQWRGGVIRMGMDYEPADLKIALSRPEHGAGGPPIFVGFWCQRPEGCVLPDLEHFAQIGIALARRGAAVNDDNGLSLRVVSRDYTTHDVLKF
jgi:hypothetical protein